LIASTRPSSSARHQRYDLPLRSDKFAGRANEASVRVVFRLFRDTNPRSVVACGSSGLDLRNVG
jgi:hypothetical protein